MFKLTATIQISALSPFSGNKLVKWIFDTGNNDLKTDVAVNDVMGGV